MEPTYEAVADELVVEAVQTLRENRTIKDYALIAVRGFAMGCADVVPGVSGGTMAFILGIYEELVESIRELTQPPVLKAITRLQIAELFKLVNWPFLLAVAVGICAAIISLAQILEFVLETYPVYVWSFFFGLVLASAIVVAQRCEVWHYSRFVTMGVGAVFAFVLVGLVPAETPSTWWFLMLSGALAICAMILPGISGAFILVLLGKYEYVLAAVNDRDIVTIAFVGMGTVIGILSFARFLGWLFKKYHDLTIAFLTGLMIGSLRKIWPWKADALAVIEEQVSANILPQFTVNGALNTEVAFAVGLALVGFVLVIVLERLAGDGKHSGETTVPVPAK